MKRILFKSLIATTLLILGIGMTACKYGTDLGALDSITVESKIYFTDTSNTLTKEDIKVTAHYVSGATSTVDNFNVSEVLPYTFTNDGITEFTVTVDGKKASFKTYKISQELTEKPVLLNNYHPVYESKFGTGVYYKYGDFPQTKLSASEISSITFESEPAPNGWYIGHKDDKYAFYGKVNDDYYKLEPIVWRQLTADYKGTGKSLFMAENILTGGVPYYISTETRTIKGKEIHPGSYTYSSMRAYLNGYDYYNDDANLVSEYKEKNFLAQAFSASDLTKIITTEVANDGNSSDAADSDNWSRIDGKKHGGASTGYADISEAATLDKVFAMSLEELNNINYGFETGSHYNESSLSILTRTATDYALATGVVDGSDNSEVTWFTRTPHYRDHEMIRSVKYGGYSFVTASANKPNVGIVPAIVVNLN